MNVTAHQEKEKNEEMKMSKRKAEERKQATDFKKAACCPSVVVQGAAPRKNGSCEGSSQVDWDTRKGQQPFRPNPNGVGDHTTTLRRLLIGAAKSTLALTRLVILIRARVSSSTRCMLLPANL